MSAIMWNVSN